MIKLLTKTSLLIPMLISPDSHQGVFLKSDITKFVVKSLKLTVDMFSLVLWVKHACLFPIRQTPSLGSTYQQCLTTIQLMLWWMVNQSIWACGTQQVRKIMTGWGPCPIHRLMFFLFAFHWSILPHLRMSEPRLVFFFNKL